jgi:hypothetical protein
LLRYLRTLLDNVGDYLVTLVAFALR